MNHLKTLVSSAACIAGTLLASSASQAQDVQPACGSVTSLQKRVVERADQGIESLRSFVWTARVTHGIEMEDVRTGLDTWRAALTCQKEAAAAAAAAVAKARTSEPAGSVDQVAAANR
ncbi:MAG: hypothetical protein ACJ8GJ_12940 [Vitreoscilla sp.]